jgi:restriction system protein
MDSQPTKPDVHVPHFPIYANVRTFLRVTEDYVRRAVMDVREHILENRGTPQETRDWSDPGTWIPEILSGKEQALVSRLWEESQGMLNPRRTLVSG